MIQAIFTTINDIITNLGTTLGSIFTSITSLFWESEKGLTTLGILALLSVGAGLVFWGFSMLMRFIRMK